MSLNKLSDYVVGRVMALLNTVNVGKYKHVRPSSDSPAKFIVVNAFAVGTGAMQKFVMNVNVHAKNKSGGNPDIVSLASISQSVLDVLEDYASGDLLIDLQSTEENIPEAQFDEHYSNLRFSLKIINK